MITIPAASQIWIAAGVTDMRRGLNGLGALVQTTLEASPFNGHIFVFAAVAATSSKSSGSMATAFVSSRNASKEAASSGPRPSPVRSPCPRAQLSMLLEGIDWRRPARTTAITLTV
jgi:transposase